MVRHRIPGRRLPVLLALLAGALLALAAPAAAAPAAAAAPTAAALPPAQTQAVDGTWYCNWVSTNRLCVRFVNGKSTVDAKYEKNEGNPITARFSYHDYTYNRDRWDGGSFQQVKNTTRSYAWYEAWSGCVRAFLNVSGGSQYASPQICP
jgi:hypothetical protein